MFWGFFLSLLVPEEFDLEMLAKNNQLYKIVAWFTWEETLKIVWFDSWGMKQCIGLENHVS